MLTLPAIPVCLWWRPSAKQTIHGERERDGEWRKRGKVEMMLSAEASLEEKDKTTRSEQFRRG